MPATRARRWGTGVEVLLKAADCAHCVPWAHCVPAPDGSRDGRDTARSFFLPL